MKTYEQAFLKLRSASVSARLGSLWLVIVNSIDLLNLEASWPSRDDPAVPIALGKERSRVKLHADFWKIIGPLAASGDFYILMRGEVFQSPSTGSSGGKDTRQPKQPERHDG